MPQESSQPWIGNHYDCSETRLLLLANPDNLSDLPTKLLVENVLADFAGATDFMKKLSRGLAGKEDPSKERLHHVWHRVAFTNYVGLPTGEGLGNIPETDMQKAAKGAFCDDILNKLWPRRIIVLGQILFDRMPQEDVYMTEEVQGYILEDGSIAVCWRISNPSWAKIANIIHFTLGELPYRCPVDGE